MNNHFRFVFTLGLLILTSAGMANTIQLGAGSSVTIGGTEVKCLSGGNSGKSLFSCLCHNTGRTDNPRPVRIYVRSEDYTTVDGDGRRACSSRNYGNPDFGFSPVSDCRIQPQ